MTLQAQIDALEAQIRGLKAQQTRCPHKWGEVQYVPRKTPGYRTKSAWWHPGRDCEDIFVPDEIHPRWSRTCETCGLTEHTERTKEIPCRGTVPGTKGTQQIPVFPEKDRR